MLKIHVVKQTKESQMTHHIYHKHALELSLEAGGKTKELKDTNHNRYSRAYHKGIVHLQEDHGLWEGKEYG